MKVLASRPPVAGASFLNEDLGLSAVAASVRSAGYECEYRDGLQEAMSAGAYVELLAGSDADVLAVTVHAECWVDQIMPLLARVKREAPEKTVVLGGHPLSTLDHALHEVYPGAFDYIVRGDGERAAVELLRSLEDGGDPATVAGLSLSRDGKLERTGARGRSVDYDHLPAAARDVWENGGRRPLTESALVSLGRGCDYACKFCSVVTFYGRDQRHWRSRSIDSFLGEVGDLAERFALRDFTIVDPDFLGNPRGQNEHVEAFCSALEASGLDLIYDIAARADQLSPELVERLHATGLRRIFLGVESGLDGELRQWKKGLTPPHSVEAIRWCVERGIYVQVGFIMLGPRTTLGEIRENLEFLGRLPYFEYVSVAAPLWLLHGVDSTAEVDPERIVQFPGRVHRFFEIEDQRVYDYSVACQVLTRAVGPHLTSMRETMWHRMKDDDGVIDRYRTSLGEALAGVLEVCGRIVDAAERGIAEKELVDRCRHWSRSLEKEIAPVAAAFG